MSLWPHILVSGVWAQVGHFFSGPLFPPPTRMDSGTDWDGEPRGVGEMLGSVPTQVGPANCPLCPLFMVPIRPQRCYPQDSE